LSAIVVNEFPNAATDSSPSVIALEICATARLSMRKVSRT